jgi:regulator of extracellular matrix RemA (YlzA/DUF370 family)
MDTRLTGLRLSLRNQPNSHQHSSQQKRNRGVVCEASDRDTQPDSTEGRIRPASVSTAARQIRSSQLRPETIPRKMSIPEGVAGFLRDKDEMSYIVTCRWARPAHSPAAPVPTGYR